MTPNEEAIWESLGYKCAGMEYRPVGRTDTYNSKHTRTCAGSGYVFEENRNFCNACLSNRRNRKYWYWGSSAPEKTQADEEYYQSLATYLVRDE